MIIKVGTQYINLDMVASVHNAADSPGLLMIRHAGGGSTRLDGNDAAAVRRYLDTIAIDVTSAEYTDSDYQDFRTKGGQLSYTTWQEKCLKYARYLNNSENWWSYPENKELVRKLEADLLV